MFTFDVYNITFPDGEQFREWTEQQISIQEKCLSVVVAVGFMTDLTLEINRVVDELGFLKLKFRLYLFYKQNNWWVEIE